VPANALLFRAEGTRIAVVDAQGRIGLRPVTLGRNYGENVEVIDGLGTNDRMVLNPSDSLAEGDVVTVAPDEPAPGPEGSRQEGTGVRLLRVIAAAAPAGRGLRGRAPTTRKPETPLPVSWTLEAPWRQATPNDVADKGPWWKRFNDAQLDALQDKALAGSPTLVIANARLAQARANLDGSSASRLPATGPRRPRLALEDFANRPLTNYATTNASTVQNDFALSLNASYELDLAGRVQRTVEGATASAEQSAADLANTRLVLTTTWLRTTTTCAPPMWNWTCCRAPSALQRRALELVTDRHDWGPFPGLDVAQQQALLDNTLTQVDVLKKQRSAIRARACHAHRHPCAAVLDCTERIQPLSARPPCRSACPPKSSSAGPTSHRPSVRNGCRECADRRGHAAFYPELDACSPTAAASTAGRFRIAVQRGRASCGRSASLPRR
jgi:hypothetical protein